jgi:hypothetical protein
MTKMISATCGIAASPIARCDGDFPVAFGLKRIAGKAPTIFFITSFHLYLLPNEARKPAISARHLTPIIFGARTLDE